MNERFFRTKFLENYSFFTERTILLNERLYWMIVQCENEQNRWKMNDNFENYQNNFFNDGKKWVVQELWTNERKNMSNAPFANCNFLEMGT